MDPEIVAVLITVGGAALIGSISYVVRTLHGWLTERAKRDAERVRRLQSLAALLRTSESIFKSQIDQRNRLESMVDSKPELEGIRGYEAKFTRAYATFTDEEKELHGLIRSMTQNALRPVNLAISEWLEHDSTFKTAAAPLPKRGELSQWLHRLELHLSLWHAKYKYWMTDKRHALVYLADEEDHGVGFPRGIEDIVDNALKELRRRRRIAPVFPLTSKAARPT